MKDKLRAIPLARTPVEHAIEQWSGYCQRYSSRTWENYSRIIHRFTEYVCPSVIRDIRPSDIQTWVNSLLSKHSAKGVNLHIAAVKSFCRWLSDTYEIPNAAAKIRSFPAKSPEARCLSREEYDKLMQVLKGRDYHLIRFLCHTGIRASELDSLKASSIKGNWLIVNGKGNKVRQIPLNESAAESVKHILKFPKSRYVTLEHCHRAAKRAGIKPFGPHACRHYCATSLLAKGVSIHHVSKFLGHSSVLITEKIYYHFRPEFLAGLTDCLDSRHDSPSDKPPDPPI